LSLALGYILKSLLWSADAIYNDLFQLTNVIDITRKFFINNHIITDLF